MKQFYVSAYLVALSICQDQANSTDCGPTPLRKNLNRVDKGKGWEGRWGVLSCLSCNPLQLS